jgi:hypothetical protein
MTRRWHRIVGRPSWASSGPANCSKVSDRITTWVRSRSSSRNSTAPGSGASPAITSVILASRARAPRGARGAAHQHVVVGLVARRPAQLVDARALGDGDPDLGDEHALEVEGDDRLEIHGRVTS